jgi:3-methyladenine DNA glycosylase AlkD
MSLKELKKEIRKKANKKKAELLQGFFKTGKGEYGEGDVFLGIMVPESRELAIKYKSLLLEDIEKLIKSKIHEERLIALLLLVHNYQKNPERRDEIYNFYLKNTKYVNNWDLVDLTCHKILGPQIFNGDRSILYKLASSDNLWERRISMISTFEFIRHNQFDDSLKLAEILLKDKHDLMHKAVGWALREIGKKNISILEKFLKQHYKSMPRTMLRYAIERLPEKKRKDYLDGRV